MPNAFANALLVSVGVAVHPGLERVENQDRVTRAATPFGDLFVLADGVGGYQGGGEAADAVVEGYPAYLKEHRNLLLDEVLQQATVAIHTRILQGAAASAIQQGPGSTVVLCVLQGLQVTYAHAGDSRIYHCHAGKLVQLSRDHSVLERMIEHGILSREGSSQHPDANVLTRALGLQPEVRLDIDRITVQAGDALLLCSDGLWAYAAHQDMEAVAANADLPPSAVASALLNLALEGGGGDNISLQFLRFSQDSAPEAAGKPKRRVGLVAGVLALALIAAVATYVLLWKRQHPWLGRIASALPQAAAWKNSTTSAANDAVKIVTSSTQDAGTFPRSASSTGRTAISIVRADGRRKVAWADRLYSLAYLQPDEHAGSDACLAVQLPADTLFYVAGKRDVAARVQQDLASLHIRAAELPSAASPVCGGETLVAMPGMTRELSGDVRDRARRARSTVESVTGAARDAVTGNLPHR